MRVLLVVLFCTITAVAQEPAVTTPNPLPQPNAEQKANLLKLAQSWEAAVKSAETARDKYVIALLAIQAELGLKPSETSVEFNAKGEPVLVRAAKPTAAKADPPKEKPEKPKG